MSRTIDHFICEVCGYNRRRAGMCPYCKIELVGDADMREVELALDGRGQKYYEQRRYGPYG